MARFVKTAMVFINIYHFFFRRAALQPCLNNLWRFLTLKPDFQKILDKKNTIEILYIGFLSGIVFMPGANSQFQWWYVPLLPLLLDMAGLPIALTAFIFIEFAKGHPHQKLIVLGNNSSHVLIIVLACFLVARGPIRTAREISTQTILPSAEKKAPVERKKKTN